MSEVKRLPDNSHEYWWRRGNSAPMRTRLYLGRVQWQDPQTCGWYDMTPGEYLPCPAPEWPPEPPPRPKMVWASLLGSTTGPKWWMETDTEGVWSCVRICAGASGLIPHDHPEQSADESRRILEESVQT